MVAVRAHSIKRLVIEWDDGSYFEASPTAITSVQMSMTPNLDGTVFADISLSLFAVLDSEGGFHSPPPRRDQRLLDGGEQEVNGKDVDEEAKRTPALCAGGTGS